MHDVAAVRHPECHGGAYLAALGPAARALSAAGIGPVAAGSNRGYMRAEPEEPVRRLAYVAEAHLPGLHAGAPAPAIPSCYEGFRLPCLEAMACGTPVVAADRTALPETCGQAALLVDPADDVAFADALLAAATGGTARAELVERRAGSLTWRRAAEQTDELIGGLLGPVLPSTYPGSGRPARRTR